MLLIGTVSLTAAAFYTKTMLNFEQTNEIQALYVTSLVTLFISMGLASSRMANIFTSNPLGVDIANEVISVFNTADSLRMITFNATIFLTIGAVCLSYGL